MANLNSVYNFKFVARGVESIDKASESLSTLGIIATALPIALTGVGISLTRAVTESTRKLGEVTNYSLILQRSTKELLATDATIQSLGISSEASSKSIYNFSNSISEALLGLGEGRYTFGDFGIKLAEFDKQGNVQVRNSFSVLTELLKKFDSLNLPSAARLFYLQKAGLDPSFAQFNAKDIARAEQIYKRVEKINELSKETTDLARQTSLEYAHQVALYTSLERTVAYGFVPVQANLNRLYSQGNKILEGHNILAKDIVQHFTSGFLSPFTGTAKFALGGLDTVLGSTDPNNDGLSEFGKILVGLAGIATTIGTGVIGYKYLKAFRNKKRYERFFKTQREAQRNYRDGGYGGYNSGRTRGGIILDKDGYSVRDSVSDRRSLVNSKGEPLRLGGPTTNQGGPSTNQGGQRFLGGVNKIVGFVTNVIAPALVALFSTNPYAKIASLAFFGLGVADYFSTNNSKEPSEEYLTQSIPQSSSNNNSVNITQFTVETQKGDPEEIRRVVRSEFEDMLNNSVTNERGQK